MTRKPTMNVDDPVEYLSPPTYLNRDVVPSYPPVDSRKVVALSEIVALINALRQGGVE